MHEQENENEKRNVTKNELVPTSEFAHTSPYNCTLDNPALYFNFIQKHGKVIAQSFFSFDLKKINQKKYSLAIMDKWRKQTQPQIVFHGCQFQYSTTTWPVERRKKFNHNVKMKKSRKSAS